MSSLTNAQPARLAPTPITPTEIPSYLLRMRQASQEAQSLRGLVIEAIALTHDPGIVERLRGLLAKVEENELALRGVYLQADRNYKSEWVYTP